MASKFYKDLSVDERKDWRQHVATELALEMLRDTLAEVERELFAMAGQSAEKLNWQLGVRLGVKECIELLERE